MTLFPENRCILTPNRDSRESRLASKNNSLLLFLWSCMCATKAFKCPPPREIFKLIPFQLSKTCQYAAFFNHVSGSFTERLNLSERFFQCGMNWYHLKKLHLNCILFHFRRIFTRPVSQVNLVHSVTLQ